ncbi:MAG: recombinase family protein [Patescibacteria group bacterium]
MHTHNSVYTEHELLTMSIFLSLGAEEIAKMRQRVMRRMTSMIDEGRVPYRAPYGYRNAENGTVVVQESESVTLRKVFELRKSGLSVPQICDELNASGVPTRGRGRDTDSGVWKETQIDRMLKNDFYVGVVRFAGMVGDGIHDTVISRDLFDDVNGDNRVNVGYRVLEFPLKGIVTDPDGKPMKASLIKKKFTYYHNDRHKLSISQKRIFELCRPLAEKWRMPADLLPQARKMMQDLVTSENRAVYAELDDVKKRKSENEKRLEKLADMYISGRIDDVSYDSKRSEFEAIREKLKSDESSLEALGSSIVEKFDILVKLLEILSRSYESATDSEKGVLLKFALVKLEVGEGKSLRIQQKEAFEHLFSLNMCQWQPQ